MNTVVDLCSFIGGWLDCQTIDRVHRVSTLIQMPSGSILNLHIRPLASRWIVSDGGSAVEEAASAGIEKPNLGLNVRRALRSRGLTMREGRIEAPAVPLEQLQMAAVAVANASKEIAEALIYIGRDERERSLDFRARQILVGRFHTWVSAHPVMIRGKSDKEHKFDTSLLLPDGRKVLIDTVNHHTNAINSAVVANLDVKRLGDKSLVQRIVFDPQEPWRPEEISLLEVGAQPVALSGLAKSIERLAA